MNSTAVLSAKTRSQYRWRERARIRAEIQAENDRVAELIAAGDYLPAKPPDCEHAGQQPLIDSDGHRFCWRCGTPLEVAA